MTTFGIILFLYFSIFGVITSSSSCPLQWNGNCYIFNSTETGFAKAEMACIQLGGHLTAIHDAFLNDAIGQNAQDYFHDNKVSDFWIGADSFSNQSRWEWLDGSTFDFQDWKKGQPSNATAAKCGASNMRTGYWSAVDCFKMKPFVCAIPSATSPPPPMTTSTTPAVIHGKCSQGWQYLVTTNSCYLYVEQRYDWKDSENFCKTLYGAHSAAIHSKEEMMFLNDYAASQCHAPWIGLKTLDNGASWQWTDGTPFDYPGWGPNEPSLENGSCGLLRLSCDESSNPYFRTFECSQPIWATICKKHANQ